MGKYPRQLSLIGDRIISNYIKNHHVNDIAFTNKNTVNYSFSKIPRKKLMILKLGMKEIIINTNQSLKKFLVLIYNFSNTNTIIAICL